MRYAVIGDVGAQADSLATELELLGGDLDAGTLPDDLTVVQLGDLVHRGPDSERVVAAVDRLIAGNDGRWIQLVGNHEAQYLRHPAFAWDSWIQPESQETLRRWWRDDRLVAAAVIPTQHGDVLVTHAGLTQEFWRRDLGSPGDARAAADRLNEMSSAGHKDLFRDGVMLSGKLNLRAGPLWAEAGRELVSGWLGRQLPFSQLHGHSSLYVWQQRAWRATVLEEVRAMTVLDHWDSHETTALDGGFITGIDPGHELAPTPNWHAWQPPEVDQPVVEPFEPVAGAEDPRRETPAGATPIA